MIKFGIVTRRQITDNANGSRGAMNAQPACTLLDDLDGDLTEDEEKVIDKIYQIFPGGDTNLKYTSRGRYRSVDGPAFEEVAKRFRSDSLVRIHDVAVSSAITSLEFYAPFAHWPNVRFHASDYHDKALVVPVPRSRWTVVFDAEKRPVQFIGKRFVISAFLPDRKRYPVNRLMQTLLKATVLPKALRLLDADSATQENSIREIRLFHPRCVAIEQRDGRFTLGRYNVLEAAEKPYEVVRLMGLVGAFPKELIEPMFRNIGESVVEGGLLIAGRTDRDAGRSQVPTTIFQRRDGGFRAVRDLMGGYQYRDLVTSLELSAGGA